MSIKLDYSLIENVELADVFSWDYPDFCDAFVQSALYDGREMTEDELEVLNEDGSFINELATDRVCCS